MNVLIDTNILIRLADKNSPHHDVAKQALVRLTTDRHVLSLVPQIIYEYWVVVTRPASENGLGMSVEQARAAVEDSRRHLLLLRDERTIFEHWLDLVSKYSVLGKKGHDARIVAAMQRHGVSHLLTFNRDDFRRYAEIVAVVPDDAVAGAIPPAATGS